MADDETLRLQEGNEPVLPRQPIEQSLDGVRREPVGDPRRPIHTGNEPVVPRRPLPPAKPKI